MFRKSISTISFLIFFLFGVFFVVSQVSAGNPASPFEPSDNVQDPGDTGTAWGGCGPDDSNCYVTVIGNLTDGDKGDVTVSSSGSVWSINANSVALSTDTTGDYVASFTAGAGLTGDASGEGSTPTINVVSANGGIVVGAGDITLDATVS
ncbi:MAG: hypothetical protein KBB16_03380, partial [Candidatus Pacebacteria bacterium]|nr:hypothetical protein [Candidatus Paceibacterota bacterium]